MAWSNSEMTYYCMHEKNLKSVTQVVRKQNCV